MAQQQQIKLHIAHVHSEQEFTSFNDQLNVLLTEGWKLVGPVSIAHTPVSFIVIATLTK